MVWIALDWSVGGNEEEQEDEEEDEGRGRVC